MVEYTAGRSFKYVENDDDTFRQDKITCPYCGYQDDDSFEHNDTDGVEQIDCHNCGETFDLRVDIEVSYTTAKIEKVRAHD